MVYQQICLDWATSYLDGAWQWNPNTDEFTVSDRWCKLIGRVPYMSTSHSVDSWNMLVHPDDSEQFHAGLEPLILGLLTKVHTEVRVWHT